MPYARFSDNNSMAPAYNKIVETGYDPLNYLTEKK